MQIPFFALEISDLHWTISNFSTRKENGEKTTDGVTSVIQ